MVRIAARRGFTLIELLVVIAVIGILVALLVPAVQKVRDAATRTQSLNNLKQIALAVHGYHEAKGTLPNISYRARGWTEDHSITPAGVFSHYSPFVAILPYLEQDAIARRYDPALSPFDTTDGDGDGVTNASLTGAPMPVYLSPAMPPPDLPPYTAFSSYAFCRGKIRQESGQWLPDDGAIISAVFGKVRLAHITDGTSNTFLAGEMHYTLTDWTYSATDKKYPGMPKTGATNWVWAHPGQGTVEAGTTVPMNTHKVIDKSDPEVWRTSGLYAFRSVHTAGVHFAFCDGSARFVNSGISLDVYQALGTRNGGEPIANVP